jgi:hypothetical protein
MLCDCVPSTRSSLFLTTLSTIYLGVIRLMSSPSRLPPPPPITIRTLLIRDFGAHGIVEDLGVTAAWLSTVMTDTVLVYLHQMLILAVRLKRLGHDMSEPIHLWTSLYAPGALIESYYHEVQEKSARLIIPDEPSPPAPEMPL